MAWSTPQLAEIAGSTVKAIRHYHEIGLLDVPERAWNGYKQYEVPHLIRLLQIKGLSDLGVPLARVAAMVQTDEEPDEAIRVLAADLDAKIERLTRVRAELDDILRHRAPAHLPPKFAPVSRELSEAQQSLLMVYSSVLSERSMDDFRQLIAVHDDTDDEFDALPTDADDATIDSLAERMLPTVLRTREQHPWAMDPTADSPRKTKLAETTISQALVELHNPAQLRVLRRLNTLLTQHTAETESAAAQPVDARAPLAGAKGRTAVPNGD